MCTCGLMPFHRLQCETAVFRCVGGFMLALVQEPMDCCCFRCHYRHRGWPTNVCFFTLLNDGIRTLTFDRLFLHFMLSCWVLFFCLKLNLTAFFYVYGMLLLCCRRRMSCFLIFLLFCLASAVSPRSEKGPRWRWRSRRSVWSAVLPALSHVWNGFCF